MRLRFSPSVAILVAPILMLAGPCLAAGGSISGTIKATGLSSNADAVVYVVEAKGDFKAPAEPLGMDQKKMQFLPHVLPVVVGSSVRFLNSDPTPHNVFSPDFEKYNLGTWPQGQSKDHAFATCAKPPCVYTQLCRVHPEMEGFIVVLQNPYFAVSDKEGHFKIDGVPAGKYSVAVWHAKLKTAPKELSIEEGKAATAEFTLAK